MNNLLTIYYLLGIIPGGILAIINSFYLIHIILIMIVTGYALYRLIYVDKNYILIICAIIMDIIIISSRVILDISNCNEPLCRLTVLLYPFWGLPFLFSVTLYLYFIFNYRKKIININEKQEKIKGFHKQCLTFDLLNQNNIFNLYTLRNYNFNINKMTEDELNYKLTELQNNIKTKFRKIVISKQTHSTNIAIVTNDNIDNSFENVDGLITNLNDIALGTLSADCQSILLFDKKQKVIGAIHSGWKGTLNKILENAIKIFVDKYNSDVNDITAVICPSLGHECFEVDEDVAEQFKNVFDEKYVTKLAVKNNIQKYTVDLKKINEDLLIKLGLNINNIFISEICTKCNHSKFHSYRYSKDLSGRNLALISLKNK